MPRLPDESQRYTPESALAEEVARLLAGHYKRHLDFLLPRLEQHGVHSIVELGCGSGLVAGALPSAVTDYLGVDKNPWFLDRARARVEATRLTGRRFLCWDVRNLDETPRNLSMAWSFMKHFALDEWDAILAAVLKHGKFGAFDVQVWHTDVDDGKDFHHVFVTDERLRQAVAAAGHEIVETAVLHEWDREGAGARDLAVWTKARPTGKSIFGGQFIKIDPARENPDEGWSTTATSTPIPPAGAAAELETLGAPTVKYQQHLEVGDMPVTDLHHYSVRWVLRAQGEHEPVLYREGKRVTAGWHLEMSTGKVPEDRKGASA